ncbi:MAG: hypothetical protein P8Q48_23965 [Paracoccaceae bacterium]|nr:hypothetical protein [Paracoccaceae bacterium]
MENTIKGVMIGESHTNCVRIFVDNSSEYSDFRVVPSAEIKTISFSEQDKFEKIGVNCDGISCLFVSFSGNFHNIFGLFEIPEPIYLVKPNGNTIPANANGRKFVSRNMLKEHFKINLGSILNRMKHYRGVFHNSKVFCVCAPPPIGDDEYIRNNSLGFEEQIEKGSQFTPRDLRMAFYKIQTEIYRAYSKQMEIEFIEPPSDALDEGGFLAERYCAQDATHGNELYGRLIAEQIRERIDRYSSKAPLSGAS